MSTNKRINSAYISKYRKELSSMLHDIAEIDIKIMDKALLKGIRFIKSPDVTPVETGNLQKNWFNDKAQKTSEGVIGEIYNNVEYGPHVNYGHRVKSKDGKTTGFVKGRYMLERTMNEVDKALVQYFRREVERVNKKHDR